MEDGTRDTDESVDRLLTDYGEMHLLLDADPKVLHEALADCSPDQLEKIMSIMEDNLTDYEYYTPSDLGTAQQFLSVWFIALRKWDKKTSSGSEIERTELDFQTLKYDQHWS